MSRRRPSLDPCELPRESLYSKTYRAALLGDGSVLPIEERLGRRILRTIEPVSPEGRRLLGAGQVILRGESEEWREPIGEVLARLERKHRREMDGEGLESTLRALERHRRDYRS